MRVFWSLAVGALAGSIAFAQATSEKSEFDAVSVKRAHPDAPTPGGNSCKGGPGTSDPGLFTCSGAALSFLVAQAYTLQFYELIAPEWMNYGGINGYDVVARLPPASTQAQFREMLRTMLAQRFLLSVHWDHKKYPEYALRRGKTNVKVNPASVPASGSKFSMKPVDGYLHLEFVKKPFSALTGVLSAFVTAPVVDETGLAELYNFTLDFMPDDRWRGFPYMAKPADGAPANAPLLEVAIKDQLGLILEKRDGSLRVLVVDKAQKSPIEN